MSSPVLSLNPRHEKPWAEHQKASVIPQSEMVILHLIVNL
jgi:hypothetical protein